MGFGLVDCLLSLFPSILSANVHIVRHQLLDIWLSHRNNLSAGLIFIFWLLSGLAMITDSFVVMLHEELVFFTQVFCGSYTRRRIHNCLLYYFFVPMFMQYSCSIRSFGLSQPSTVPRCQRLSWLGPHACAVLLRLAVPVCSVWSAAWYGGRRGPGPLRGPAALLTGWSRSPAVSVRSPAIRSRPRTRSCTASWRTRQRRCRRRPPTPARYNDPVSRQIHSNYTNWY